MQNLAKAHWTDLTSDSKPLARSSHSISFNKLDNRAYLWGGEHIAREAIDSKLWVFDNTNNNWSCVETTGIPPEPRVAHSQAITNNNLFIWGGRQGIDIGDGDLDDFHKLDLNTLQWEKISAENGPLQRSFQQMCATEGKVHIFGGCAEHTRLADLHTYDVATNKWTKHPDNP